MALDGTGYGRIDIRRDERTGEFLVLEANCNCGLSTDGETSVSWILRLSNETMPVLLDRIFTDAVARGGPPKGSRAVYHDAKTEGVRRVAPAATAGP